MGHDSWPEVGAGSMNMPHQTLACATNELNFLPTYNHIGNDSCDCIHDTSLNTVHPLYTKNSLK